MEPSAGPVELPAPLVLPAKLAAAWPVERWRDVHVLVAVSGGADSMALLRAVLAAKIEAGGRGRVFAGHVNHGLRGDASDADQTWLHDQCVDLGVPLRVEQPDVVTLAAEHGDGLEAAARASRYDCLTAIAERTGCRFIATGHTRDDQVETVLFRFLRGTGLHGLAGIPRVRRLAASVTAVRPLLDCTRADVLAYLQSAKQSFRQDATNDELHFARNRIRRLLLPFLREHFNAEVDAAIGRTAALAGEAEAILDTLAAELLACCRPTAASNGSAGAGGFSLTVAPLTEQPELLVAEVLRQAWRAAGLPEQSMTQHWWRQLTHFAVAARPGPALNLPGDLRATRPTPTTLALGRVAAMVKRLDQDSTT